MAKKFLVLCGALLLVAAGGAGAYLGHRTGRAEVFQNSSASRMLANGGPTQSATPSAWRSSRASPDRTCG